VCKIYGDLRGLVLARNIPDPMKESSVWCFLHKVVWARLGGLETPFLKEVDI